MTRIWAAAMALPGVVVALVTGVSGIAALVADRPLLLASQPASLAEASGNRDAAEVVLRLAQGEDINRPIEVRIPQRFARPITLTPLEAAVASERTYMIRLMLDHGAAIDAKTLRRLRCFAERRKDRGTIAFLAEMDPSPLACDGVAIPGSDPAEGSDPEPR